MIWSVVMRKSSSCRSLSACSKLSFWMCFKVETEEIEFFLLMEKV
jgi:hypothetical protein